MPDTLARRGAQVAGDRGPHLRADAHAGRRRLRRLPGHAQPGLRRHGRRVGLGARRQSTARRVRSCSTRASSRQTFFFSSSGGRTANVQDVWNGSKPTAVPRLRCRTPTTRSRPTTTGARSRCSALRLGKRLGSRGVAARRATDTAADGRVRSMTLIGTKGNRTVSGSSCARRARASLDVVHDRDAEPDAARPLARVRHPDRLVGLARGIPQVTLESRPYGGQWKTLAVLQFARRARWLRRSRRR